jgi:hypothetical protein
LTAPLAHLVERELGHPVLAVATHSHGDHVGGLHEFEEASDPRRRSRCHREGHVATLRASDYGETVIGLYRDAGYDIPDVFVDATPPGGLGPLVRQIAGAGDDAARRRRRRRLRRPLVRGLAPPGPLARSIGLWESASGITQGRSTR